MARAVADHPGRLGCFAALPLPQVDASLAEIGYALDVLRTDGIGLLSSYDGLAPRRSAICAGARRAQSAPGHALHPSDGSRMLHRLVPGVGPGGALEAPTDTARTVESLLVTGTLSRLTGIRIIVGAGGGTLPFVGDPLISAATQAGKSAAEADKAYFTTDALKAALARLYLDTAGMTNLADWGGADRVHERQPAIVRQRLAVQFRQRLSGAAARDGTTLRYDRFGVAGHRIRQCAAPVSGAVQARQGLRAAPVSPARCLFRVCRGLRAAAPYVRLPAAGSAPAKELDELPVEGRNVIRLAAGDEVLIHDHLFIHRFGPGIVQVRLERGPGREPMTLCGAGLDHGPGPMADRADRLAASKNDFTNATALGSMRRLSGFMTPPGSSKAS